jgi:phage terminase large subunit-like protein
LAVRIGRLGIRALAGHDPRTTVSLYSAPKDCALDDETAIRAANPSFDFFMNRDEILAAAKAALRMPAREAAFRRYTLNQRIEATTPFIAQGIWDGCHGSVAPLTELPVLFGGIDLSSVNDLTALVLVGREGSGTRSGRRTESMGRSPSRWPWQ